MTKQVTIRDRTHTFTEDGPALLRSDTGEAGDRIILATAAAHHCVWQRDYLHDYVALPSGQVQVRFMNQVLQVAGYGRAFITSASNRLFILRRVYHVPDLEENLFSTMKLDHRTSTCFAGVAGGRIILHSNEVLCEFPYKGKFCDMQGIVRTAPGAKRTRRPPPDDTTISVGQKVERIDEASLGVHREIPRFDGMPCSSLHYLPDKGTWGEILNHEGFTSRW